MNMPNYRSLVILEGEIESINMNQLTARRRDLIYFLCKENYKLDVLGELLSFFILAFCQFA
jgi:hypothetical protein